MGMLATYIVCDGFVQLHGAKQGWRATKVHWDELLFRVGGRFTVVAHELKQHRGAKQQSARASGGGWLVTRRQYLGGNALPNGCLDKRG